MMKKSSFSERLNTILIKHKNIPLIVVFLLMVIGVSIRVPGYIGNNYMNILRNGSINLVMAVGSLFVLLIGSIDISVSSILALSGAIAGMMMRDGHISTILGMFAIGIAVGLVFGLMNGVLMSYGKILPIIVTLGMSYVARAFIPMDWLLGMNKITPTELTPAFKTFALKNFLGLPILVWIAIFVALIAGIFLRYTKTGRNIYAVGSNQDAAQVRGVHINKIKVLVHTICGALAGVCGVLWLAFYNAVEKGSASGDEMFAIAACVLGGVSVAGGSGSVGGVVIGALMIAFINNAIPQISVGNSMITEFVKGILLLFAVLLNVFLQRQADKRELGRRNI